MFYEFYINVLCLFVLCNTKNILNLISKTMSGEDRLILTLYKSRIKQNLRRAYLKKSLNIKHVRVFPRIG